MTLWNFNQTIQVKETPMAWNALHERYSLQRCLTLEETAHNVWQTVRYESYTDEQAYFGSSVGAPTVVPPNGLRHYRGGYTFVVSDQDRTDLIASGFVDATFFVAIPGT